MKIYSENESYKLYQGNMLDMLEIIQPNTIDSVVCDPPYELNFMNKGWDNSGIAFQKDTWEKCFEVLKPGGYLLAFGGSRTFHRIAVAIEDAGFEIRDTIMWLYGSGFPKSMDIEKAFNKRDGVEFKSKPASGVGFMNTNNDGYHNTINQLEQIGESSERAKQWQGWGTALKPSFEPIIVARKPFKGSLVDNVIEYGVGGINIDECRVEYEKTTNPATNPLYRQQNAHKYKQVQGGELSNGAISWTSGKNGVSDLGRFPANTILTYDEIDFEEVCGGFPNSKGNNPKELGNKGYWFQNKRDSKQMSRGYDDNGSASRYFYCAKASKKDRDEGCDTLNDGLLRRMRPDKDDNNPTGLNKEGRFAPVIRKNTHPTVKPTELMQYLVRLVTPQNGTILDPFNGSGSTGKAVMYENKERNKNYKYVGIELTKEYLPIAQARIEYAFNQKSEIEKSGQTTIFDFLDE